MPLCLGKQEGARSFRGLQPCQKMLSLRKQETPKGFEAGVKELTVGENDSQDTFKRLSKSTVQVEMACNTVFKMLFCLSFEVVTRGLWFPLTEWLINSTPPSFSLIGLSCPGLLSTYPIYARARCQTTRKATMPQRPLMLFKLARPKPLQPASLILSRGNHSKGSCLQVFPLPLPRG